MGNRNGGFSKRAFGGRKRLDKIDLMKYKSPRDPGERILFQQVILDSLNNYLFFGLAAKNGTSRDEFYYACEYLFRIRASNPDTWKGSKKVKVKTPDGGKKKSRIINLTDEEIKIMCFDTHYMIANFSLPMDVFLNNLIKTRKEILIENYTQVQEYLQSLKDKSGYDPGYSWEEALRILSTPENPEELAKLVCYVQKKEKDSNEESSCDNFHCSSS